MLLKLPFYQQNLTGRWSLYFKRQKTLWWRARSECIYFIVVAEVVSILLETLQRWSQDRF